MNIATNLLINLITTTKVDSVPKDKTNISTKDDKVDIKAFIQDKTVQTLLSSLITDMKKGAKSKNNITNILTNNKQAFELKNLSNELKGLINSMQDNKKLSKQISILKNFILNIETLDEKSLKSTIQNSGIFLESNLAKSDKSISANIKDIKKLILEMESNNTNTTNNNKTIISNEDLFKDIKSASLFLNKYIKNKILVSQNIKDNSLNISNILANIPKDFSKITKQDIQNIISKLNNLDDSVTTKEMKFIISNINSQLNSDINMNNDFKKQTMKNIENITIQLKNTIENKIFISNNVKSELNDVLELIKNIPLDYSKLDKSILKELLSNLNILNKEPEISDNIKKLIQNIEFKIDNSKEITTNNSLKNLTNLFIEIKEKLNNIYSNNVKIDIPIEIKETFNKILQFISDLTLNPNEDKYKEILKSILILTNNMEKSLSKIEINNNGSIFNSLKQNSALDAKSIVTNDLKATILQIEKQILDSKEKVPKELKMQIERVNNQIEYYQLLSCSSNTTHTFLPFQWDELDDADIKFNKKDTNIISCQINLSLKNKGDIKVLLQLENSKNITIDIGVEKKEFQELISNNLQKIRVGISKIGLILQTINIFSIRKHNESYQEKAYGEQKLNFGLDIKI